MSLWGNNDNVSISTAPTSVSVVGTAGSEFWTVSGDDGDINAIPTGTTLIFGSPVGSAGFAVLESYLDVNLGKINIRSCVPNQTWATVYANQPIQMAHDPGFNGWSANTGVTTSGAAVEQNESFADIGRTQKATGISTDTVNRLNADGATATEKLFRTSAGWVGVMTYMSLDPETGISTLRVKKEVYVAQSGIETGNRPYPDLFL